MTVPAKSVTIHVAIHWNMEEKFRKSKRDEPGALLFLM